MSHLVVSHLLSSLAVSIPVSFLLPFERLFIAVGPTLIVGLIANGAIIKSKESGPDKLVLGYGLSLFVKTAWLIVLAWLFKDHETRGATEVVVAVLLLIIYRHCTTHCLHVATTKAETP